MTQKTLRITHNRLPSLQDDLRDGADRIVRQTAFLVQAGYQERSAVDTGAQKNSAYVVTANTSTYTHAASAASAARPGVELTPAPATPAPLTAIVGVGVGYAAVNEFGGAGRSARPALVPAVNAQKAAFIAALKTIIR